ncbi:Tetracenomycin polyketide synthesis O-methyltransferase TcmP [Cytospora mali]|uniref:Tetracenomycin polyketide synthesis O-methyltransferase TcmP n=1 Tax=Cytospora mali TaxID=578113 RepID=A0A194VZ59_CYTMA|nr:Tetracenomycin polyketide synthesis O-methyltransferase TcmP [Valsa mali]
MAEQYAQRTTSDSGSSINARVSSAGRLSSRTTSSSQSSQAAKAEIKMGSEEEKLLMVWYLRVRDAASENPILEDKYAAELMDKMNFDITRSSFKLDATYVQYVCGRSKLMDQWAQDFLDQHTFEDVLVLQLACGLDSRCLRLNRRKDVKWIDVDRPKVTNLRKRLIAPPETGDYTLMTALVAEDDDSWLKRIPADKPTLIIMEGLTYYLEPEKGLRLFQRLLRHFSHGNLVFDTLGSLGVVFTSLIEPVKKMDTRVKWGIDDADDIKKLDDRLVLRNRIFSHDYMDAGPFAKGYPPMWGNWTPLISLLPGFKKNGQFLHFEF